MDINCRVLYGVIIILGRFRVRLGLGRLGGLVGMGWWLGLAFGLGLYVFLIFGYYGLIFMGFFGIINSQRIRL